MKKNYSMKKLMVVAATFFGLTASAQIYCNQQATSTNDDEIFNVTLGTLNNTSACLQMGGPGSIASMYQNYTGLTPPILTQGSTQTISVTGGQCSGFQYSGTIYVWIDYNQNGILNDPGELVWQTANFVPFAVLGTVYTGTFTIPLTTSFGPTRMRITLVEGTVTNPCQNFTWGEVEDYNVNIIANTPCSGTPLTNTVVPATYSTCPGLLNPAMSLSTQYTVGGIQYQWFQSTVSNVGPFTPVAGATLQSAPAPTLGTTTWYQAVVTCTNSNSSSTTAASMYFVDGAVVNTVPYMEGFENIQATNRLPNCSWWATSINGATQTYTGSASNNRLPFQGNRFASFFNSPAGTNFFYSNGIQMEPGITYSVGLMYTTEYFGFTNWNNLGLYIGSAQTPTAMNMVVQTAPAVSGPYKELGATFTVATSGVYFVGVRAQGTAGSAPYLSWDNLTVNIPCTPTSGNSPTISLSASSQTICAGDQISLNVTGTDTYTWSNGANGSSINDMPMFSTSYSVVGTNTITGCTDIESVMVTVNPAPVVYAFASSPEICPGETTFLSAVGASAFSWNNGSTGSVINVGPTANTTYSVIGTNQFGCSGTGVISIVVKPNPTIGATSSNANACIGEQISLTAAGGVSYTWINSSSPVVLGGNPANLVIQAPSTFTVMGTGANGCVGKATIVQGAEICSSISENTGALTGVSVYPNPTSGIFTVELKSGSISSVVVTDVTGRTILNTAVTGNTSEVNLDGFSSGVYYVKISSENSFSVVRVVKN